MEVALTRTSTSVGPTGGTGTFSSRRPLPACVFRNALIVGGIQVGSLPRQVPLAQRVMLAQPSGPHERAALRLPPPGTGFPVGQIRLRWLNFGMNFRHSLEEIRGVRSMLSEHLPRTTLQFAPILVPAPKSTSKWK